MLIELDKTSIIHLMTTAVVASSSYLWRERTRFGKMVDDDVTPEHEIVDAKTSPYKRHRVMLYYVRLEGPE